MLRKEILIRYDFSGVLLAFVLSKNIQSNLKNLRYRFVWLLTYHPLMFDSCSLRAVK
jgi:hypothetical protein